MKEKRVLSLEYDLMIALCYVIPINSTLRPRTETDMFTNIINDIATFKEEYRCNFIVCGDMNARTSDLPDYVSHDNYVL